MLKSDGEEDAKYLGENGSVLRREWKDEGQGQTSFWFRLQVQ